MKKPKCVIPSQESKEIYFTTCQAEGCDQPADELTYYCEDCRWEFLEDDLYGAEEE